MQCLTVKLTVFDHACRSIQFNVFIRLRTPKNYCGCENVIKHYY